MESPQAPLKANEYQCALCKGVFNFGWSEEEATIELEKNFPGITKEDCAIVCDDCYKQMGLNDD